MNSKKSYFSFFMNVALLFATTGAFGSETPPANKISEEQARKIVSKVHHEKIQEAELEFEGGRWIYSFDLKNEKTNQILEVQVDAISGKIVNTHTETAADEKKEALEDQKNSK